MVYIEMSTGESPAAGQEDVLSGVAEKNMQAKQSGEQDSQDKCRYLKELFGRQLLIINDPRV